MSRVVLLLGVAVTLAASVAHAADSDSLRRAPVIGDQVRVTLLSGPTVTGRILAYDATTMGMRLDDATVGEDSVLARRLARESIAGLEVRQVHSHPWRGAIVGALVVPAAWAFLFSLSDPQGEETLGYLGPIFLGPIVGGITGAAIGAGIQHERWKPARLPPPQVPEEP